MILQYYPYIIHYGKGSTAKQGYPHLLPPYAEEVGKLYLIQRHASDNRSRGLAAAVAAGAHEHGDEGYQYWQGRYSPLKVGYECAGYHGGNHQHHQPHYAALEYGEHRGFKVCVLTWHYTCHLLEVLGSLVLNDVHHVVYGDYTHQPVLPVHNGHGQHVVLGEHLGDLLLVVVGVHAYYVGSHYVPDPGVGICKYQIPEAYYAVKVVLVVQHVALVYGFLVYAVCPYHSQRLIHGKRLL